MAYSTQAKLNSKKPTSLNLNVRGLGQSATLAIKARCRELRDEGRSIYDFGLGQSPFPVPTPVVEALRLSAREKDYLPVEGLPALREAIASFHKDKDGIDIHPDDVLVGPGSKELMFLVQLVYYGEIVLRSPCWVSYLPQAQILGRRMNLYHTSYESGWKITAEELQRSFDVVEDDLRPRLLVFNYPNNPTGNSYSAEELKELAEVIRKFEVIVLSDEIYAQLHHEGRHVSIARFCPERTIVSSGLSKWCGAGGWRLGTFAFPRDLDWLRHSMAAVASETYTTVSAPIQHAAVEAFRGSVEIERYLWHTRRILAALARRSVAILRQAGIRVHMPVGAFYLFLDFTPLEESLSARGIGDGQTLCDRLLEETGVAILPGVAFARSRKELTARLSYVDFDGDRTLAASEKIPLDEELPAEVVERCCGRVLEGVRRISDWATHLP
jgi:aspartate aminotransferase